jgi:hypothetical protein
METIMRSNPESPYRERGKEKKKGEGELGR